MIMTGTNWRTGTAAGLAVLCATLPGLIYSFLTDF